MAYRAIATLLVLIFTLLSGCASSRTAAPNPLEIDRSEYGRMYTAAVQVLRDEGFVVERQDYRFGVVSTQPRPSPTLFEPWYQDNTLGGQMVQSTTNSLRRVVTVTLEPVSESAEQGAAQGDEQAAAPAHSEPAAEVPAQPPQEALQPVEAENYQLRVEVILEQLQAPIHHLSGSTDGRRVFARLRRPPDDLPQRGIEPAYWQPLGRDEQLEQRLLAAIVRQSIHIVEEDALAPAGDVDASQPPPTEGL